MGLLNRLYETGRKTKLALGLAGALALSPLISGCGSDSGDDSTPKPNEAPVFKTIDFPTTSMENQEYTGIVEVEDAEGDEITLTVEGPTGHYVNQIGTNEYEVKWTPEDFQSDDTHYFQLEISDGYDHNGDEVVNKDDANIEPTNLIYVTNVETALGNIKAFLDDSNLENIRVQFDSTDRTFTTWTNSNGNWQVEDMPDGTYDTMIKDDNTTPVYDTYIPGSFIVNKTKADESKLEKNCKLLKIEHREFLNDCMRYNGELRRWKNKPLFNIYTIDEYSGTQVDSAKIDEIKDVIINDMSTFCQDTYDFTESDIELINEEQPGEYEIGYITIGFDDGTSASGLNSSQFDSEDYITASSTSFHTTAERTAQLQELTENLIGSGETNDPAYLDSILYDMFEPSDPEPTATQFSDNDLAISKAVYNQEFQRAHENACLGGEDWNDYDPGWDNNPVIWNE